MLRMVWLALRQMTKRYRVKGPYKTTLINIAAAISIATIDTYFTKDTFSHSVGERILLFCNATSPKLLAMLTGGHQLTHYSFL